MVIKKKKKTKTKRGKKFLGELLKPIGGKFLLHCNFEVSKLNISHQLSIGNVLLHGQN